MAHRISMANGMAIAMAVVSEQNMAHSTPLHSYGLWSCFHVVQIRFRKNLTYAPRLGFGDGR